MRDDFPGWHRAPHDATHWAPDSKSYSECWWKKEGGLWWFAKAWAGSKRWIASPNPPSKYRFGLMVKRSQKSPR